MIELIEIHHVSLSITDLDRAKQFYGEILGFSEIKRPDFDFPGAWYQIGGQQLHLIVNQQSDSEVVGGIDPKAKHFAIQVKDFDQALAILNKNGIDVRANPNSHSGFGQIFFLDPDGNLIEFNAKQNKASTN